MRKKILNKILVGSCVLLLLGISASARLDIDTDSIEYTGTGTLEIKSDNHIHLLSGTNCSDDLNVTGNLRVEGDSFFNGESTFSDHVTIDDAVQLQFGGAIKVLYILADAADAVLYPPSGTLNFGNNDDRDYEILFDSDTNDGSFKFMENDDYFLFDKDVYAPNFHGKTHTNPFNQDLNTTDNATFDWLDILNSLNISKALTVSGITELAGHVNAQQNLNVSEDVWLNGTLYFTDDDRYISSVQGEIKVNVADGFTNQFVVDINGDRLLSFLKGISPTGSININEEKGQYNFNVYGQNLDYPIIRTHSTTGQISLNSSTADGVVHVNGDIVRDGFFQGFSGTSQSHAGQMTMIHNFTGQTRNDDDYYHHSTSTNPGEITIVNDGWYRVSYTVNWDNDVNDRVTPRVFLTNNDIEVIPSASYGYARYSTYARFTTNHATFIAEFSADDVLKLESECIRGAGNFPELADIDTIVNEDWILIEKI